MSKRIEIEKETGGFFVEEPWFKDYMADGGKIGEQTLLIKVVVCEKGLLLLGDSWKDFVFKGRQSYETLLNLLDSYTKKPEASKPLLLETTNKKSGDVIILDSYRGDSKWVKEPKAYYFNCPQKEFELSESNPNPLNPTSAEEKEESTPHTRSKGKSPKQ